MRRDLTSEKLDFYEFKISLFYNGKPEALLFLIRNINITLEASGTIKAGANIQYLHTMLRGEVLRQFDALSDEVESAIPEALKYIILVLGM